MTACEHANESSTPSMVMPAAESTTTSSSSTQPVEPPPPAPAATKVVKPAPKAEPDCEQIGFQTRAGPKWVCKPGTEPRVRVVKESR